MEQAITNQILKKYDTETSQLIAALTEMIETYETKLVALEFRDHIMKITFHTILLYKQKLLDRDHFNAIKYSFRYVCSSTTNAYRYRTADSSAISRISQFIRQFQTDLLEALGNHADTLRDAITATVGYISNEAFLTFAYRQPQFKIVAYTLVHYLETTR